jgi:tape measure domain-containing protein
MSIKYILEAVDKITPTLKKVQASFDNMNKSFDKTKNSLSKNSIEFEKFFNKIQQSVENTGKKLRNFGLELTPVSLGLGILGKSALQQSASFETLAIQLEILTGSAERGKELFNNLTRLAAETPFSLNEIVKSTRTILGSGISYEKSIDTIKMLGDVSAGSGANLESLAVVFGQVAGATKLQGQDALQFISNSIPIWQLLNKSTGLSIEQLKKLSSDGKISFGMLQEALKKATEQNGMYYKATDKLSKSLSGVFAKLKDDIDMALAKIGDNVVQTTDLKNSLNDVSAVIAKLTEKFNNLSPETKKFIVYFGIATTLLAPLLLGLGQLVITFSILAGSLGFLISGFASLGLGIIPIVVLTTALYKSWDKVIIVWDYAIDKLKQLWEWLTKVASIGIGKIANLFGFDNKMQIETTSNINTSNINNNKLQAGGSLDIFFNNMPQGTKANFTPTPKNFMNVGLNTVYGGI